jgi:riboflavin synthase
MFTGLIEAVGKISDATRTQQGLRMEIEAPFVDELEMGESVAINGVCLTVTSFGEGKFAADVIPESLDKTTLGHVQAGSTVNLERALKVGARLGGHFVLGHVDGVGLISKIVTSDSETRLVIEPPSSLLKFIANKGSVVLNGVSLTVSDVTDSTFEVSLVPHTLKETTLGNLEDSDIVNIEVDVLARYMDRLIKQS